MKNSQFAKENFIRVEKSNENIEILVCEIAWHGPHSPIETWSPVHSFQATTDDSQIDKAIEQLLLNEQYFAVCPLCKEVNVLGYMSGEYCQSCSEQVNGIVY